MPRRHEEPVATRTRVAGSRWRRTRRVIVVEYRDEVAARLIADFSARDMVTERVSWPGQLSRLPICRDGTLIVINRDQPFAGG
ncbi:MAG: hypothetical protein R6U98_27755 [Pirellulaceae bacterium]